MVVKMITWRRPSRKFETKITVYRVEGVKSNAGLSNLGLEIKWKGSKRYLRRSEKRNYTKEEGLSEGGFVEFIEEFSSVCRFQGINKEGAFYPWEVTFTLSGNLNKEGASNKISPIATVSLNLSDFAPINKEKDVDLSVPLSICGGVIECSPSLCLSLNFLELSATQEYTETVHRSLASSPFSGRSSETLSPASKDEVSAIKAGLRKVKNLTRYVSNRGAKRETREGEGSEEKTSYKSDNYPFDTDSLNEEESEEGKEIFSSEKSDVGPLPYSSFAKTLFYVAASHAGDDDFVYYSNRRSDDEGSNDQDLGDQAFTVSSKRSIILPWRKRKLSYRSFKNKSEPLLKKDCREAGGDDIDRDRRTISSSDESSFGWHNEDSNTTRSPVSEFGDDCFVIGSWESKEIVSRDGQMKLQTQVFFASIDQRNEKAAGESACTALVAVIANWFQLNPNLMPIRSQLDSLIREGSSEWRNLCDNEAYKELFPDKHFDLDTVLEAKIRPLCVIPEKSFIGFFHPEGIEEIEGFAFLKEAMSFDSIWDEISQFGDAMVENSDPMVFIISWNDHFFVLKVEKDAYFIIDTLGERLYEGCNQAYILKFDRDTAIQKVPEKQESPDKNPKAEKPKEESMGKQQSLDKNPKAEKPKEESTGKQQSLDKNPKAEKPKEEAKEGVETVDAKEEEKVELVCRGKNACKEYIKSFLASIPIRELEVDLKKGLMASTPLHQRLQIEFHFTKYLEPVFQFPPMEVNDAAAQLMK